MQDYLWEYFDPDNTTDFSKPIEPVAPAPVVDLPEPSEASTPAPNTRSSSAHPGGETTGQRKAREAKYDKDFDRYIKLHQIWRDKDKKWENYHVAQTRLREKIQLTIAIQKAAKLQAKYPVRKWLAELKASTAPTLNTVKRSFKVDYQQFIRRGHKEWPSGEPSAWLAHLDKRAGSVCVL